jgi:hypothetical protein
MSLRSLITRASLGHLASGTVVVAVMGAAMWAKQPVVMPNQVATVAITLCAANDGLQEIRWAGFRHTYTVVCHNGAHFLDMRMEFRNEEPQPAAFKSAFAR